MYVTLRLEDLFRLGKNFKWERPMGCLKCKGKLWGHGFSARYFQGFPGVLWIKRWRCSICRAVLTSRPEGYWPRIQSSIQAIFGALRVRLTIYRWPPGTSRQRGWHWLWGFLARLQRQPEWRSGDDLKEALERGRSSGLRFV
jgi:hypothetical protein